MRDVWSGLCAHIGLFEKHSIVRLARLSISSIICKTFAHVWMSLNARVLSLAFKNQCTPEFMELSFSLARNAASASLPAVSTNRINFLPLVCCISDYFIRTLNLESSSSLVCIEILFWSSSFHTFAHGKNKWRTRAHELEWCLRPTGKSSPSGELTLKQWIVEWMLT